MHEFSQDHAAAGHERSPPLPPAISFRTRIEHARDPRGPDGQGWNRLALIALDPVERCTLRPSTWQGAMDTLRGVAAVGNPAAYLPCVGRTPCATCRVASAARDPWNAGWHIREDDREHVWLLGNLELGFAGRGHWFATWADLLAQVAVLRLRCVSDRHGVYWTAY